MCISQDVVFNARVFRK